MAMEMEFSEGEEVYLQSGGPFVGMTIDRMDKDAAGCTWAVVVYFDNNGVMREFRLRASSLRRKSVSMAPLGSIVSGGSTNH